MFLMLLILRIVKPASTLAKQTQCVNVLLKASFPFIYVFVCKITNKFGIDFDEIFFRKYYHEIDFVGDPKHYLVL